MTSQDEEEDDHERSGTDSANDTDATLVEDAPPRVHERLPTPPPPPPLQTQTQVQVQGPKSTIPPPISESVLGKRNRPPSSEMDIDAPAPPTSDKDRVSIMSKDSSSSKVKDKVKDADIMKEKDKDREAFMLVSRFAIQKEKPAPPEAGSSKLVSPPAPAPAATVGQVSDVRDVEMQDLATAKPPPPLPPRKPREVDDSVMMFGSYIHFFYDSGLFNWTEFFWIGRQHDVSECMDNCMFQIETALLNFEETTGSGDDKTSIVKR